jgi:hypothetical protein
MFAALTGLLAIGSAPALAQPLDTATPASSEPRRAPLPFYPDTERYKGCGTAQLNVVFEGLLIGNSPTDKVSVRLNESLGDAEPRVRAFLVSLDFVTVTPSADFELTTLVDYPQTMVLVDAKESPDHWRTLLRRGENNCPVYVPRQFPVGDVTAGNSLALLKARLAEEFRGLKVFSLPQIAGSRDIETCVKAMKVAVCSSDPDAPNVIDGEVLDRELYTEEDTTIRVRNRGSLPRHVYFGFLDDSRRIDFAPVRKGADRPLLPGEEVEFSHPAPAFDGRAYAITLTSEAPIDPRRINQAGAYGPGAHLEACRPRPSATNAIALTDPLPAGAAYANSLEIDVQASGLCPRVGGGDAALASLAPWMAQIYDTRPFTQAQIARAGQLSPEQREHHCGGSVIGPGLILTAAHCVAEGSYAGANEANARRTLRVRTGSIALGGGRSFAIDSIAVHAGYATGRNVSDIALIKLKAAPGQALPARAIALSENSVFAPGTGFEVFGWGFSGEWHSGLGNPRVSINGARQMPTEKLRYGPLTAIRPQNCPMSMRVICAATPPGRERKVFTCFKDSGGPLIRTRDGRQELVGVVNFSKGCAGPVPTVFASVASYGRWIDAAKAWLVRNPGQVGRVGDPALAE